MKRLLLRADDLGYSEAVNCGIAKTVRDGLIRSVGLMPSMPAARHGLQLLAGLDVCLGQHTDICVGPPVSDPAAIPSRYLRREGLFMDQYSLACSSPVTTRSAPWQRASSSSSPG